MELNCLVSGVPDLYGKELAQFIERNDGIGRIGFGNAIVSDPNRIVSLIVMFGFFDSQQSKK